jgi:hypothetical protein
MESLPSLTLIFPFSSLSLFSHICHNSNFQSTSAKTPSIESVPVNLVQITLITCIKELPSLSPPLSDKARYVDERRWTPIAVAEVNSANDALHGTLVNCSKGIRTVLAMLALSKTLKTLKHGMFSPCKKCNTISTATFASLSIQLFQSLPLGRSH